MQKHYFPGQQTDEHVLYVVHPHIVSLYMSLAKITALALFLLITLLFLSKAFMFFGVVSFIGAAVLVGVGSWVSYESFRRSITYITDRRIVRFEAATPFATNSRALTWDEVVKVKTFPRNVLWKMMKVGTIIVHAKSTYVHTHEQTRENVYTNDDLDLEYVYYYKDLGNYIDKILYTYKHSPHEVSQMHPFVPKPAGQRD
ncbi:MAG TPA: hypothetical protein VJ246_00710 [Patescibacteria group bacterium]|nr:hypothetical protein [Patescibacteria group bacterium]